MIDILRYKKRYKKNITERHAVNDDNKKKITFDLSLSDKQLNHRVLLPQQLMIF